MNHTWVTRQAESGLSLTNVTVDDNSVSVNATSHEDGSADANIDYAGLWLTYYELLAENTTFNRNQVSVTADSLASIRSLSDS